MVTFADKFCFVHPSQADWLDKDVKTWASKNQTQIWLQSKLQPVGQDVVEFIKQIFVDVPDVAPVPPPIPKGSTIRR